MQKIFFVILNVTSPCCFSGVYVQHCYHYNAYYLFFIVIFCYLTLFFATKVYEPY